MERLVNVEAERSRKGMSRTEFSKKLGVSSTTYKRYVDGKTPIPSDKLILMTGLLGCSSDYLLNLNNERTIPE